MPETFVGQRRETLFAEQRPRLMGLAYRMLGTVEDAELVIEMGRRRWYASDAGTVADPCTALVTIVARLSRQRLDRVRPARQGYAGSWLPEPVSGEGRGRLDLGPSGEGSLSLDLLAALEGLSSLERAAYVLRVTLGYPYAQVAVILGRREPAVRQLVHRSRTRLACSGVRLDPDRSRQEMVVRRFAAACRSASLAPLADVLAPDVVLLADDRRPAAVPGRVVGRDRTARSVLAVLRRLPRGAVAGVETVNGASGMVVRVHGQPVCAVALTVDGASVAAVQLVASPGKLGALRARVAPTAIL